MDCELCDVPMGEHRTTAQAPYAYTLAGLPHVGLANITIWECPVCKVIVPVIPRMGELHRVITDMFLNKQRPLTGAELRFLRKSVGFSAQKFAALLLIDPAHLSRVENGKQPSLGPSTDRLARLTIAAAAGGRDMQQMLLREATARLERKKAARATTFRLEKNRWKLAA